MIDSSGSGMGSDYVVGWVCVIERPGVRILPGPGETKIAGGDQNCRGRGSQIIENPFTL